MCKHIYEKSYSAYSALWIKPVFYPPHINTAINFAEVFKKFSINSTLCLAAEVYTYGTVDENSLSTVRGVLRAGNLLSLMKTGMGLLHWTQRASTTLKIHMIDLMQYMATNRHTETYKFFIQMMKNFVAPSAKQYSWPWARLFWDGAFLGAAAKTNMDYAFVMVSIVAGNAPESPLCGISSLNCDGSAEKKFRAMQIGQTIHDLIISNDGATAQTDPARELHARLARRVQAPLNIDDSGDLVE